jgi:hypothetical protein
MRNANAKTGKKIYSDTTDETAEDAMARFLAEGIAYYGPNAGMARANAMQFAMLCMNEREALIMEEERTPAPHFLQWPETESCVGLCACGAYWPHDQG